MPFDNLTLILQLDRRFDDLREMLIFEALHFPGQGPGVVTGLDGHTGLEDRFPMVILFIYVMDRDPRFLVRCGDDRFVHKTAVHTLAAVFGQQGRVNIDDPAGIRFYQRFGDLP